MQPPVARTQPHRIEKHGHVRSDDFFWLNRRDDPEVIAHLEAENAYVQDQFGHTEALQRRIFEEIKARIPQTDESAPVRMRDYWYYTRTVEDLSYPIHCRKLRELDAPEEILLDVNQLAEGHEYCDVAARAISSGQQIMAYALDTVGRRIYTVHLVDLRTGESLDAPIEGTGGNVVWAEDDRTFFYTRKDPQTLRPWQVYRHVLGTDPAEDDLIYQEDDDTYYCGLWKSKSRKFLFLGCEHTLRSEVRYLPSDQPEAAWTVLQEREGEHEYSVDHLGEWFYVRSNHEAPNFRLFRAPTAGPARENWEEIVAHRRDTLLSDFELFDGHLVLAERFEGLRRLRVLPWSGQDEHLVDFGEPAYMANLAANPEPDTTKLRYSYSSMTTPPSVYEVDLDTRETTLVKQQAVGLDFDREQYVTERTWATSRDGTRVPISLVYRRGAPRDGSMPTVLYGYGSYGISLDASFSAARLSLLDRGFAFAIANIRGGSELGRAWYEGGKKKTKWNTFQDFIACGEHLVAAGYTRSDRMFCWGGSAGGLLVGTVLNERPDLFHGAIAQVPFVDVVTTMLDDSIPLTTGEYDEWGDPNDPSFYHYMISYSPYDNVKAQDYPHMLVISGLHDSQVQYWEPTKWVAHLRRMTTGDRRILLKTNMGAGHGGASDRYEQYREVALEYAFFLDLMGIVQ